MQSDDKSDKFEKVQRAALRILAKKGLAGFNHSELARLSGVSRSWIYKYFGQNKDEALDIVVDHYSKQLVYLRSPRSFTDVDSYKKAVKDDTSRFFQLSKEYPEIVQVIFMFYFSDHKLGRRIRKDHAEHIEKLSDEFINYLKIPQKDALDLAWVMSSMRLGIGFFIFCHQREGKEYLPHEFTEKLILKKLAVLLKEFSSLA